MNTKVFGRTALTLGAALLVTLFAWEACSDEITIIQVHRNITLSDDEAIFRDYYIDAGTEQGLKTNLVVNIVRKTIVKDGSGTHSYGDIITPVGQLKVIFTASRVAIAREYKQANRETTPVLDQAGVQIGDIVDLKGAYVDNRKIPAHNTAEVSVVKPAEAVVSPALVPASAAATAAVTAVLSTDASATIVAPKDASLKDNTTK
jgi:hypothetical protein